MRTVKTYEKTFTNKAQAQAYYNKIRLEGNLVTKGMGRVAGPEGLWVVHRAYAVSK